MEKTKSFDRDKLATFAALAMMFAGGGNEYDMTVPTEQPKKRMLSVPNAIPKGHSEFWFDKNGEQTRLKAETVFYCTALNLKNAVRKFNNFKIKSLLGKFFTYKNFEGEDIKFKVHWIDEKKNGIIIVFPDFDNHWECRGLNDFMSDLNSNKFTPCNNNAI